MAMDLMKKLYLESPAKIQNVAISAYGLKKYQERFLGRLPEDYRSLGSLLAPPEAIHYQVQATQLTRLIAYAQRHVPFYRDHLKDTDVSTITPKNLHEFLPVITKKDIVDSPSLFISENTRDRALAQRLFTSGSSGTPLEVMASNLSRRINYHYYQSALKEFDCAYRSRSTTLAGRVLYKAASADVARYDYFNRTQYLSSYNISNKTIKGYIEALNQWKPDFIDSYPSALTEIISFARKHSLAVTFKPKVIITSSENLTSNNREMIETFFCCTVLDQYGCTEMSVNAFSSGGYYFSDPRYSINEVEATFGESGPLICTSLINLVMPLIRYKIGDVVTPINGNPYLFESIDGRLDDVIVTPDGKRVGRIDPAFKGIQGIELAQVIQTDIDQIIIKVVLAEMSHQLFNSEILIQNMRERTSDRMNINVEIVEEIAKEKNGKFKSVVNLYKSHVLKT